MTDQQSLDSVEGSLGAEHGHGFDVRWRHYYPQLAIHPPHQFLPQTPHQFYSTPQQQQGVRRQQPISVR